MLPFEKIENIVVYLLNTINTLVNEDDKEAIKRRMLAYSKDISHKKDYDYVLINDNVENCFNKLKKIISKHLN